MEFSTDTIFMSLNLKNLIAISMPCKVLTMKWKTLASEAGLDFGEQPDDEEFTHFDAFIYRFLDSIPTLKERVKALRQAA